jgi:hypothetical protein
MFRASEPRHALSPCLSDATHRGVDPALQVPQLHRTLLPRTLRITTWSRFSELFKQQARVGRVCIALAEAVYHREEVEPSKCRCKPKAVEHFPRCQMTACFSCSLRNKL